MIERLALAGEGLKSRALAFAPDAEIKAVAGDHHARKAAGERIKRARRTAQRARNCNARDGVGSKPVQNRALEPGALCGFGIGVKRIPVSRQPVDEGRARIDRKTRNRVGRAVRDDGGPLLRRFAAECVSESCRVSADSVCIATSSVMGATATCFRRRLRGAARAR